MPKIERSKPTVVAKKKVAAKAEKDTNSLVKCEVTLEAGEWVSPTSCQVFYIDDECKFPVIDFEFKSEHAGPFEWGWEAKWIANACPQQSGKPRFTPKGGAKIFIERGVFSSNDKKWRVNLAEKVIGGEITVTVKVGAKLFRRKAFILANGPTREKIFKQLDSYEKEYESNARLAKLIFKQESNYRQFYSDGMPLVSFDKGYGLGQATTPAPTYEQTWNWRLHIDYIIKTVLPEKRSFAKHYLKAHPYTDENLDMETLVHYNGANYHYYVWSEQDKKWVVNDKVLCDPLESNKGWDVTSKGNENKTLEDLRSGKGEKQKYTGRCYAEHIKSKM